MQICAIWPVLFQFLPAPGDGAPVVVLHPAYLVLTLDGDRTYLRTSEGCDVVAAFCLKVIWG
jgi:hypothetical protein